MKKVFFASAAILMAVLSTQAQSDNDIAKNDNKLNKEERKEIKKEKKDERSAQKMHEPKSATYQSKEEFYRNFGDHPDAVWSATNAFDKVVFDNNGVVTTAYYDFDAKLVGTTNSTTFENLPQAGQKQILKDYKDYTVKSVVFFDDNEDNDADMILYNSRFEDADNYFVELQKDNKTIVVQVTMDGLTGYFTEL